MSPMNWLGLFMFFSICYGLMMVKISNMSFSKGSYAAKLSADILNFKLFI